MERRGRNTPRRSAQRSDQGLSVAISSRRTGRPAWRACPSLGGPTAPSPDLALQSEVDAQRGRLASVETAVPTCDTRFLASESPEALPATIPHSRGPTWAPWVSWRSRSRRTADARFVVVRAKPSRPRSSATGSCRTAEFWSVQNAQAIPTKPPPVRKRSADRNKSRSCQQAPPSLGNEPGAYFAGLMSIDNGRD